MLVVHVHVRIRRDRSRSSWPRRWRTRGHRWASRVLRFDVIQDEADPQHVVLVEVYRDGDASAASQADTALRGLADAVAEMMAEPRR